MNALILAAGFGTRLRPLTETTPKPLFPVAGTPVLERTVRSLEAAGVDEIAINAHHLAPALETFIHSLDCRVPLRVSREDDILGTGGAIKNLQDFLKDGPFLVVNGDVVSDIDYKALQSFHESGGHDATLVLHDCPRFNNVETSNGRVTSFSPETGKDKLTFTGIQMVNPVIFDYLEPGTFQSSIAAYKAMMQAGLSMGAWQPDAIWWHDMGSFEGLSRACLEAGALDVFASQGDSLPPHTLTVTHLAGGGSSREWYRLASKDNSIVAVDHGVRQDDSWNEADAYHAIGNHLRHTGSPVPEILAYDSFAGIVFARDLGDTSLERIVMDKGHTRALPVYKQVVRDLATMAEKAAETFDPAWTCQTQKYDKALILDKESRYFVEAFVNGYAGISASFDDYLPEFDLLAERAAQASPQGFLHRDFQSRNVMVHEDMGYFIDFQGGRLGPMHYDLASLFIDPYVQLPTSMQDHLMEVYLEQRAAFGPVDKELFLENYRYCALHRNLQILGAFAYLSQVAKKPGFMECIPPALDSLKQCIVHFDEAPRLQKLILSLKH